MKLIVCDRCGLDATTGVTVRAFYKMNAKEIKSFDLCYECYAVISNNEIENYENKKAKDQ